MEKRYKFRIYPTERQTEQIQQNFGCVRFVYNYFLNKRIEKYEAGEGIYSYYEACKDLTALKKMDEYRWLRQADSHSLQNALKNLNNAYAAFFRRVREKDGAPGFPRFKSKKATRQSYTTQAQTGRRVIDVLDKAVLLPKLGWVKCSVSRKVEGRILSASVLQVPSGKYFVSICCTDFEPEQFPQTGASVGLHFGIRTLATTSEGVIIENYRHLEKAQKKISRLRRRLSRKTKDSHNREKARIKLARAHEKVSNQKTDIMQKVTTQIVSDYDIICVRGEQLIKMVQQQPFAYYLSDASWGGFSRMLEYKSRWYGKHFVKIAASYPSVQLCNVCGYKNSQLAKKRVHKWTCPNCGAMHERAKNAAVNTLAEGLRKLAS